MYTSARIEEFFNKNHSKADGRFASGASGGNAGSSGKVTVKNDWHNTNHAVSDGNGKGSTFTKAQKAAATKQDKGDQSNLNKFVTSKGAIKRENARQDAEKARGAASDRRSKAEQAPYDKFGKTLKGKSPAEVRSMTAAFVAARVARSQKMQQGTDAYRKVTQAAFRAKDDALAPMKGSIKPAHISAAKDGYVSVHGKATNFKMYKTARGDYAVTNTGVGSKSPSGSFRTQSAAKSALARFLND